MSTIIKKAKLFIEAFSRKVCYKYRHQIFTVVTAMSRVLNMKNE